MMLKSKERPKAAQAMPRVLVRVERRMECGCPSVSVMVIVSLSPSASMIATVILEHRARSVILLVILPELENGDNDVVAELHHKLWLVSSFTFLRTHHILKVNFVEAEKIQTYLSSFF